MNDAQVEEIKRYFGVVAEALRSDIRQIAEGHSGIQHELRELGACPTLTRETSCMGHPDSI